MSAKLMGQIWGLVLTEPERSVLMALADHADDDGDNCYPGLDYLEWKLDKTERQLRRILSRLAEIGVLKMTERGNGRGNKSQFKIDLSKGVFKPLFNQKKVVIQGIKADIHGQKVDIDGNKGGNSGSQRWTSGDEKVVIEGQNSGAIRKNHIEPITNPSEEPVKRMRERLKEVFEYWQVVMEKPKSSLTPERQKKIEDRLYKHSVDEIKSAIDGCRGSPHNMGQNDRNTEFNDIELICRTETKLEQFIERASKPKVENGANGNGQNGTTQSKFAADSQERAESFVRSVSYFDRRVEAAYRAADSTEALVKRTTDPTGPD